MNAIEQEFSYYKGVCKTTPVMSMTLYNVYAKIKSFCLKEITEKIRKGKADKDQLPGVTFSGIFSERGDPT